MKNKNHFLLTIVSFTLLAVGSLAVSAQTNEFTYQGRLTDNGTAPTGNYDLQFDLFDAASSGNQKGATITLTGVSVSAGIFSVKLDFGEQFDGNARFLQIAVKATGGANQFTPLNPRQVISSAPYAVRSKNAATADTAVNATTATNSTQLGGVDANQYVLTTDPRLVQTSGNFIQNSTAQQSSSNFNISGTGSANILDSATQYNVGGNRVLAVDGNSSTFVGLNTTTSNTGINNSFVGSGAGQSNTTGIRNTFLGAFAGNKNSGGSFNTFVGEQAGFANTQGSYNSFFGYNVGNSTTTGNSNSFFGSNVGAANTTGLDNSFFGAHAGQSNTTGIQNSFFGTSAGLNNDDGYNNAFFGESSGSRNTTGGQNSFFGKGSGGSNIGGDSNSFFGVNAGYANTEGNQNTLLGADAGQSTSTGTANTFVGSAAGLSNLTGEMNTTLGYYAGVGSGNLINATAIGSRSSVTQSNSLVLGSNSSINPNLPDTNVGIGTNAPQARLHIATNGGNIVFGNPCVSGFAGLGFASTLTCANYSILGDGTDTIINRPTGGDIIFRENNGTQMTIASGGRVSINTLGSGGSTQLCRNASNQISSCSSSLRYKTNVNPFISGLKMVKQFRPITFDWKDSGMHDLGLGAEDVAKVNDLLVVRNVKGEVEGVKYDRIGVVLINAVKEQQSQIERQNNLITLLEARLARVERNHHKPAARTRRTK